MASSSFLSNGLHIQKVGDPCRSDACACDCTSERSNCFLHQDGEDTPSTTCIVIVALQREVRELKTLCTSMSESLVELRGMVGTLLLENKARRAEQNNQTQLRSEETAHTADKCKERVELVAKHVDFYGSDRSLVVGGMPVLSAVEVGEGSSHVHANNNGEGRRDVDEQREGTVPEGDGLGDTSTRFLTDDEAKSEVQNEKAEEKSGERGALAGREPMLEERNDVKALLSAAATCRDAVALRLTGIGLGWEACRGHPKERGGGGEAEQTSSSPEGEGDLSVTYHTYQADDDRLSSAAVSSVAEEKSNSELSLTCVRRVALRNVGRVWGKNSSHGFNNGANTGTCTHASDYAKGFFHLCLPNESTNKSITSKCVYDTMEGEEEKEEERGGRRAFLVIFKLTADFEDHWCDDYVSKDVCVGFARIARPSSSGTHCIARREIEEEKGKEEEESPENNTCTRTPRVSYAMPSSDFSIVLGISKEDYYPITHYVKGTTTSYGTCTAFTHSNAATTTATSHLSSENRSRSNNRNLVSIFDNRFCQKEFPTRSLTTTRRYAVLLVLDGARDGGVDGDSDDVDNVNGAEKKKGSTNMEEGQYRGGYFRAFRSESGLECDMKPLWDERRFTLPTNQPLSGRPSGHEQGEDRQRTTSPTFLPQSSSSEYALVGNLCNRGDEITIEHILVDNEVPPHYLY